MNLVLVSKKEKMHKRKEFSDKKVMFRQRKHDIFIWKFISSLTAHTKNAEMEENLWESVPSNVAKPQGQILYRKIPMIIQPGCIHCNHAGILVCLCWGFTAQSTQWGHVERGQFT